MYKTKKNRHDALRQAPRARAVALLGRLVGLLGPPGVAPARPGQADLEGARPVRAEQVEPRPGDLVPEPAIVPSAAVREKKKKRIQHRTR